MSEIEKYESLNNVIGEAIAAKEQEQALEHSSVPTETASDKEKDIAEVQKQISEVYAGTSPEERAKEKGTIFAIPEKKKESSFGNKARSTVVKALLPLLSFLPMKSLAGGVKDGDKVETKKESVYTRTPVTDVEMAEYKEAFYDLSDQDKKSWNMYIDHLREIGLANDKGEPSSPKLNNKEFAEKTMQDWIDKMNSSDPDLITLTVEKVGQIQKALFYYEESLDKLEEEAEKNGKTIRFGAADGIKNVKYMEGLKHTKSDNIAGPYSTMYKFPDYIVKKKIEKPTIHGTVSDSLGYTTTVEGSKETVKTTNKGFADPTAAQMPVSNNK